LTSEAPREAQNFDAQNLIVFTKVHDQSGFDLLRILHLSARQSQIRRIDGGVVFELESIAFSSSAP
jgi:hypothetical protein